MYLVTKADRERLAEVAANAYQDYPLYNWFAGGTYDRIAIKLIIQISLKTMTEDAVTYTDSEEMSGFPSALRAVKPCRFYSTPL